MPWSVIGSGAVNVIGAVRLGRIEPMIGLALMLVAAVSLFGRKRIAVAQIGFGLTAGVTAVLVYVGPVAAVVSDRTVPTDPTKVGVGLTVSMFGAVVAILGGLATVPEGPSKARSESRPTPSVPDEGLTMA